MCPFCGLSTFESNGDVITCKKCGKQIKYLPSKELLGVGFDFPHKFVAEWYDAQAEFIKSFDVLKYNAEPMYSECGDLYEVIPYEKKRLMSKGVGIELYGDRLEIQSGEDKTVWRFEDTTAITVLGKNKLNIYYGDKIYQIKPGKRFNALKYVHVYHRSRNMVKGETNEQFLGL